MYLGRNPAVGTQRMLDSIESQFNGVLTTFDLRYGGVPTYPTLSSSLIVSLGGVLQEPGEAYYVSSDKIVFSQAPNAGLECWILLYSQYGTGVGAAQNGTLGAETLVLTGQLQGPSNFIIDPAVVGDDTGTVEIKGNLTVQGTTTTINSTTVDLDHISLGNNEVANFGNSNNLKIYHNATDNYFDATSRGQNVFFRTSNSTTLDTNALSILANGNVGIGITNPSHKAYITGSAVFDKINNGYSGFKISDDSTGDYNVYFDIGRDQGNSKFWFRRAGRVQGITPWLDTAAVPDAIAYLSRSGNYFAGNVGIGITNSTVKTHCLQSTGGSDTFYAENSASNNVIGLKSAATFDNYLDLYAGSNSGSLIIRGGGTERLRIDANGRILTDGVTSGRGGAFTQHIFNIPSNKYYFEIRSTSNDPGFGDILFSDAAGGAYGIVGYDHNTDSLRFHANSGERLRITSTGNVGIGTTNPEDRLDLASGFIRFKEAIGGTGTYGGIRAYNSLVPSISATAIRFIRDVAEVGNDGAICFDTTNNERVRISSTGNVGIGTTNPGYKLELSSASGATTLKIGNRITGSDYGIAYGYFDETGGIHGFSIDRKHAGTLTEKSFILRADTGNVCIGASDPQTKLDVRGYIISNADNLGVQSGYYLGNSGHGLIRGSGSNDISLYTTSGSVHIGTTGSTSQKVTVDINGNIGVGTTNPGRKLDVRGGAIFGHDESGDTHISKTFSSQHDSANRNKNIRIGLQDGSFAGMQVQNVQGSNPSYNSQNVVLLTHNGAIVGDYPSVFCKYDGLVGIGTADPQAKLDVAGNVQPSTDATHNLGSPTARWANIYSADLQLSNEGSPTGNEVDGTWGAYTIQEGEEALYLINRRSGKKFKFVLEEVK